MSVRSIYREVIEEHPDSPPLWGYFVIRTTYDDNELWRRFLNHMNQEVIDFLRDEPHGPELIPLFRLHPIEDKAQLDGADMAMARHYGRGTLDAMPEECDPALGIPLARGSWSAGQTSRHFALVVNSECLELFSDWEKEVAEKLAQKQNGPLCPPRPQQLVFAINLLDPTDSDSETDEDEDDEKPEDRAEFEGEVPEEPYWMFIHCEDIVNFFTYVTDSDGGISWEAEHGMCRKIDGRMVWTC